ncbi:MAG: cysteate synthase [Tidjanibacter sp.]|nr:cysteate synthase [Tidjanibacter sp.]
MLNFSPTTYRISSCACSFDDDGTMLEDSCESNALLRTDYKVRQLRLRDETGLYRYSDWLPVRRRLSGATSPTVWKSRRLAETIGLNRLFIVFNGWFPNRGGQMTTCSFKETEAYAVCSRFNVQDGRILVVASAGNTARAFAKVCSDNHIPLLLSVPADNIGALWFDRPIDKCVRLICTPSGSDYYDAIELSGKVLASKRFIAEGGARNVARRDGMATSFLAAAFAAGGIPDCYFQAVGSGTGAIAAWEANLRLIGDGRFGSTIARLMLSQNAPFRPIYEAWQRREPNIAEVAAEQARGLAQQTEAKVLTNRRPPYGVKGGLFDALSAGGGEVYSVTNAELRAAQQLFLSREGIDIAPAAGVTVASLLQAAERGDITPDQTIALNITGGGEQKFRNGRQITYLKPSYIFGQDADPKQVISRVEALYE